MDGIVAASISNDTGERFMVNAVCARLMEQENSGSTDNRDSGVSSGILSPRMLRHRESEENTLRFRTRNAPRSPGKMQHANLEANINLRSRIASSTSPQNGATSLPMRPERSHSPYSKGGALATRRKFLKKDSEEHWQLESRVELETRIAWIRGHYREREVLLEDQIERLEETYTLARAELDPQWRAGDEVQVDSADDHEDYWETTSDYPPTEPRGRSRSPSPIFAVRVRVASS